MSRKVKHEWNRIMAFVLAVVLVVCSVPFTSIANDEDENHAIALETADALSNIVIGGELWKNLVEKGGTLTPGLFAVTPPVVEEEGGEGDPEEVVYSYKIVEKEGNTSGLAYINNNNTLRLNSDKDGVATIGIYQGEESEPEKVLDISVVYAELDFKDIIFSDIDNSIDNDSLDYTTAIEAKNYLRIQAADKDGNGEPDWTVGESPNNATYNEIEYSAKNGIEYDSECNTTLYFVSKEEPKVVAKKTIKFELGKYEAEDNKRPQVSVISVDGRALSEMSSENPEKWEYDSSGKIVECRLYSEDENFSFEEKDGFKPVTFYMDGQELNFSAHDDQAGYRKYSVVLPRKDLKEHILEVKTVDSYKNVKILKIQEILFKYNPLMVTYYHTDTEKTAPVFEDENTHILYFDKTIKLNFEFVDESKEDKNIKINIKKPSGTENKEFTLSPKEGEKYSYDTELFSEDGEYEVTFSCGFGGDDESKNVKFIIDQVKPQMTFEYKVLDSGIPLQRKSFQNQGEYFYANKPQAVFTIEESNLDYKSIVIEELYMGNVIKTITPTQEEWKPVSTVQPNKKVYSITMNESFSEGYYSFNISGNDLAGNQIELLEDPQGFKFAQNGNKYEFKRIVIDRTAPEVNTVFDQIDITTFYGPFKHVQHNVKATVKVDDSRSPIYLIEYGFEKDEADNPKPITADPLKNQSDKVNDKCHADAEIDLFGRELDNQKQPTCDFCVRVYDMAGNKSEWIPYGTWVLDSINPVLKVESEAEYTFSEDGKFAYSANGSDKLNFTLIEENYDPKAVAPSKLEIKIDGHELNLVESESEISEEYDYVIKPVGGTSDTWVIESVQLNEGNYTISVEYEDPSGRQINAEEDNALATTCLNGMIILDQTAPELTLSTNDKVVNSEETIYFNKRSATYNLEVEDKNVDKETPLEVHLYDAKQTNEITGKVKYNWVSEHEDVDSFVLNLDNLEDGEYYMTVTCKDKLGNSSTTSVRFVADESEPSNLEIEMNSVNTSKNQGNEVVYYFDCDAEFTLRAVDETTKIEEFTYWLEDENRDVIVAPKTLPAEDDSTDNGAGAAKANDLISAEVCEGKECTLHYTVKNHVGRENKDSRKIVIDTTAPSLSFEDANENTSPFSPANESRAWDIFNENGLRYTIKIDEGHIDPNTFEVRFYTDGDHTQEIYESVNEVEKDTPKQGMNPLFLKNCPDGHYYMVVSCSDMSKHKTELATEFVVDTSAPNEVSCILTDSKGEHRADENGTLYFQENVTVTITAKDDTTKIKRITYWIKNEDQTKDLSAHVSPRDDQITVAADGTVTAVFDLPLEEDGQLKGVFSFEVENEAGKITYGNSCSLNVDKKAPVLSYQFSDISSMKEWNNTLYFPYNVDLTITVDEKYFDRSAFTATNGENVKIDVEWGEFDSEHNTTTGVIRLNQDQEYQLKFSYTDASGRNMTYAGNRKHITGDDGTFTLWPIVIDNKDPMIRMSVNNKADRIKKSDDTAEYYDDITECTVVITEKNFTTENLEVTVTAKDINDTAVDYNFSGSEGDRYQTSLSNLSTWHREAGTDKYSAVMLFDKDARYSIHIEYTDPSGRKKIYDFPENKVLVVDKTAPTDLKIDYNVDERNPGPDVKVVDGEVLDGNGNVKTYYYHNPVTVEFYAKELISGLDKIEYEFVPNTTVTEQLRSQLKGTITGFDDVPGTPGLKKATVKLPREVLDANHQLNGYFKFEVTNLSQLKANISNDTRIVADNIKPEISVSYSGNYLQHDQDLYFASSTECRIVITEENFFAEDVKVKINGSPESLSASRWSTSGHEHVYTLPLTTEGDYVVEVDYTDRSGNVMDQFKSPKLVLDYTDPVIRAEVSSQGVVNDTGSTKYYDSDQTLIITVKEHNFNKESVRVRISAVAVDGGSTVSDEVVPSSGSWNYYGDDTYSTSISLSTEGIYSVSATCADYAGRDASCESNRFAIDKSAPVDLSVSIQEPVYETTVNGETYDYYNGPVSVTVSARDNISGIQAIEYKFIRANNVSGVNTQIETVRVSESQMNGSSGSASFTFRLPGNALGANGQLNGILEVTVINNSMLSTSYSGAKRIIADNIAPSMTISYNNHVNEENGVLFFNQKILGSVAIEEANFIRSDVGFGVTKNGVDNTPEMTWEDRPGDKHFGNFDLGEDGRYQVSMSYADRSGNAATSYRSPVMVVDTTAPQIRITGVANETASKAETIGFVITVTDENLVADAVTVSLQAEIVDKKGNTTRPDFSADGIREVSQDGKTLTYTITNLEKDAVYTVRCTAKDKANNEKDTMTAEDGRDYQKLIFSVNRNGSNYLLSKETEELVGSFSQNPINLVIEEINPSKLHDIKVTLFKDNQTIILNEGTDYKLTQTGSVNTWYRYTYVIDKSLLDNDGIYRLSLYSEDDAGNVSSNTLDNKNIEISFGIDKTSPTIIVANLEEKETYPVKSLQVIIHADDNIKLVKGMAYLDGKELATWDEQTISDLSSRGADFTVEITDESTKAHTLKVIMTDAAGNQAVSEIEGFYVTTNLWIRFINNKPLVIAVIIAALVLVAGGIFLATRRRKYR